MKFSILLILIHLYASHEDDTRRGDCSHVGRFDDDNTSQFPSATTNRTIAIERLHSTRKCICYLVIVVVDAP